MEQKEARVIKASRNLQAKVGTGRVDENRIAQAQAVMDENTVDFRSVVKSDLDALRKILAAYQKNPEKIPEKDRVSRIIMNIKANAGTFKYELVSTLSAAVLTLLDGNQRLDKKAIRIIDVLYKTVLFITHKQIKGDGGKEGRELADAFAEMCDSYKK